MVANTRTRPSVDHQKTLNDGGTNAAANLGVACLHCNVTRGRSKSSRSK